MRKKVILGAIGALVALCGPTSTAPGDQGHVDAEFGIGGELALSPASVSTGKVALLSEDRMLLVEGHQIRALLPSGQADTAFGEGGVTSVTLPPSGSGGIGTVIRDESGRLVGLGACWFPHEVSRETEPQNYPSKLLIERWTPDGDLDLSFGGGDGMVVSDFDLPPAKAGLFPGLRPAEVTLDTLGRIVIAGGRESGYEPKKTLGLQLSFEPFVARLTPEGEVDRSLAGSGALELSGLGWISGMAADRQGGVLLSLAHNYDTTLAHLAASGEMDADFGEGGFRRLASGRGLRLGFQELLGEDPSGRAVFASRVSGYKTHHVRNGVALKRLNPAGSLDRSFGHNGILTARFRRMLYSREALDDRGRVLVALAIRPPNPGDIRTSKMIGISLARLRPNGNLDRSFGRRGILKIPFDPKRDISLDAFQLSGEVALIEKSRCDPGKSCHPVLIRVELGSS